MESNQPTCVACGANAQQVPLLKIIYQDQDYYICPPHFPLLIHDPSKLVGKLPGAENLKPAQH
jgi:hypothetical protein